MELEEVELTKKDIQEITKIVIKDILSEDNDSDNDSEQRQNEKKTLEGYKKKGYKIIKPFKKILPIRAGKNKGEEREYFGYVMRKDSRVFAKVFTTDKRDKMDNVWA